jgi:hypothetical protein
LSIFYVGCLTAINVAEDISDSSMHNISYTICCVSILSDVTYTSTLYEPVPAVGKFSLVNLYVYAFVVYVSVPISFV